MEYQKTEKATDDLIGNKIADAKTKFYDGQVLKVLTSSPRIIQR